MRRRDRLRSARAADVGSPHPRQRGIEDLDDDFRGKIKTKDDIRELFIPRFYFEHGLIDDDDVRDFMFARAVRFWGKVNPDFFKGRVVEKQAAEVLARPAAR